MANPQGERDANNDGLVDALSRVEHDVPSETEPPPPTAQTPTAPPEPLPPPASAAEFRRPARPASPGAGGARPAAPTPPPAPAPTPAPAATPAPGKPRAAKPKRPDRPDRPTAPPTTTWSQDEAAEVAAHYDPLSEIVEDDDAVMFAPDPDALLPHAAKKLATGPNVAFRRTVIPILLTCGVLLIGIGLLKWVGGSESLFRDMSTTVAATLCGSGVFLLIVAALNMMQVRAELAAAAATRKNA